MKRTFERSFIQVCATVGIVSGFLAVAQAAPPAPAGKDAPAAGSTNCKTYSSAKCCDPAMTARLSKEAVFSACGQSDAAYLGERGNKDECRYYFKVEGEKEADMYVSVSYTAVKPGKPMEPQDPFVTWKKAGPNTYIAQPKTLPKKASDKVKAINTSSAVGVFKSGNGFFVTASAPSKICSQAAAKALAASLK